MDGRSRQSKAAKRCRRKRGCTMVEHRVGNVEGRHLGAQELKQSSTAFLLVAILLVSPASSTVYLVLVTPDAVVVGTDSRSTNVTDRSLRTFGNAEKVVAIANGHILIGTIGLSTIEHNSGRKVIYNFPDWARALKINPDMPIMQVARVVANDSFRLMNGELSRRIHDGKYSPEDAGQNPNRLVGYYIAKCDPSGCAAVKIEIAIDSKKRALDPPSLEMKVPNRNSYCSFFFSGPSGGVIERFLNDDAQTKQFLLQRYPKEVDPVFRNHVLMPEELLGLDRLLLSREITEHPSLYGFPVAIHTLTGNSTAKRHDYTQ